ncbi:MAG: tRNA (adenosine(37)-N6)-dimethylallyltransferase MiaA [Desulfomonilia bacterium]
MARQTPIVVITGPTCSGKTGLSMELSRTFPIEVISADSMQVYRYMDIATAKPTREEQVLLPHHLIDIVNPDEDFNAGMFAERSQEKISEIKHRGRIPIVVGGTGLYIKALIYGLVPVPSGSPEIRSMLRRLEENNGTGFLKRWLDRLDPESGAKINQRDAVRIIRYLEIILLTGVKPSVFFSWHRFRTPRIPAKIACIIPDRKKLYREIDARVVNMMEQGLMDETSRLLSLGYHPNLKSMQTLAYRHTVRHMKGELSLQKTIGLIQRDTRHYAKRQITWMKANAYHELFPSAGDAVRNVSRWIEDVGKHGME